jgi:hypothetical protein
VEELCKNDKDWIVPGPILDFSRVCIHWELDPHMNYIYNNTCAAGETTYDCTAFEKKGKRAGRLNQTIGDDFYTRGEWEFDDPEEEMRYEALNRH